MIILDFDGVVCDSAFEAFRIALATEKWIESPFDSNLDELYPEFLKKRISVGPAWNYFYVLRELLSNEWGPWEKNSDSSEFERQFFACRRIAQDDFNKWILLNPLYENVKSAIAGSEIYFLTNKNKEPVEAILKWHEISYEKVFSMTDYPHYSAKVDFMNEVIKKQKVKFIDDHVEIVRDVISRSKFEVDARHAAWGYTREFLPNVSLNLDELGNWLENDQ